MDILYAEGIAASNSLNTMEFSFTRSTERKDLDSIYQHNPSQRLVSVTCVKYVFQQNIIGQTSWSLMRFTAALHCIDIKHLDYT